MSDELNSFGIVEFFGKYNLLEVHKTCEFHLARHEPNYRMEMESNAPLKPKQTKIKKKAFDDKIEKVNLECSGRKKVS